MKPGPESADGRTPTGGPGDEVAPGEVELEISDVLDLHSFPPQQVSSLVRDWLDLTCREGHRRLRIIHGRGVGVQRRMVRSILEKDPRVRAYGDAPPESGGWGATWIEIDDGSP